MAELTILGALRKSIEGKKALSPISDWRSGWRIIGEPFSGAWQRNQSESRGEISCYPTLYACLHRISSDIGKLPFQLKRRTSEGTWAAEQNPAYSPVLRKPNKYQTEQQFREAWVMSKLMSGNTYVLKGRDERGVVNALYVLDPWRVQPMVSETGSVFYQLNYGSPENLLPVEYTQEQIIVPAREIIHDRMNCLHHQLIGVSPLCAANWPAVKNLKILRSSAQFFGNNAAPGGILTAPAGMKDEDAKAIKEYWDTNFGGENSGKVAVIGADMKFTAFAFKAADSQLVEQMRYSDEQICQPFGIPPFKVGIGSIPAGLGVDAINLLYHEDALSGHIEAIENLLDEALGLAQDWGIWLDTSPLFRMDEGKQAEVATKLVGGGVETPNEGRRRFNLPALEGGDTVYMQQQDYPLDQVRLNRITQPVQAPVSESEDDEIADRLRAANDEIFKMRAIAAARTEVMRND